MQNITYEKIGARAYAVLKDGKRIGMVASPLNTPKPRWGCDLDHWPTVRDGGPMVRFIYSTRDAALSAALREEKGAI